jgi:hypothetical protein
MFGSLIRRKAQRLRGSGSKRPKPPNSRFPAAVPRPVERRADNHLPTLMPAAKLIVNGIAGLCRIRNISAGGLTAEVALPHAVG